MTYIVRTIAEKARRICGVSTERPAIPVPTEMLSGNDLPEKRYLSSLYG